MFGIGMGPSKEQSQFAGLLGNVANFGTSQGESDILQSQKFWSSILSGDMSKISQVLGPQISAVNKQTQQRKKTASEFGNRGGGTNAVMANLDTSSTSAINDMISNLTSGAASTLGSMGSSLLSTGTGAGEAAFTAYSKIHDEKQAKWADIFKSIGSIAGAVAPFFPAGGAGSKLFTGIQGEFNS